MKTSNLPKEDKNNIAYDPNDLANIFNINERDDIGKFFNLNRTLILLNVDQLSPNLFDDYVFQEDDHWTLLASKFYDDVNLWWFICKVNNIFDPTTMPSAGTVLKIPTREVMQLMIDGLAQG